MKRFVDLRGAETGYQFAWWDTIVDRFEMWSDAMAWDTWDEFAGAYHGGELDRYARLVPDWTKEKPAS